MIKLEVDPWCHEGCEAFDADVHGPTVIYNDGSPFSKTDTIIYCSRRGICRGLKRYLEKEVRCVDDR